MFIGGLNWDTTDGTYTVITRCNRSVVLNYRLFVPESLRNYFSQFGKVDACTIMRDAAGRSRCFAFLTFDDPASVNAVMVREHFLDGKIVRTLLYLLCGMLSAHMRFPYVVQRSILNEQYQDKSINERPSCSSVVLQAV